MVIFSGFLGDDYQSFNILPFPGFLQEKAILLIFLIFWLFVVKRLNSIKGYFRRDSSVVERGPEKAGVGSPILSLGTI